MAESHTNIDYKAHLDKALTIIETQQLSILSLQLQLFQLKKLVYGSRHEKFMTAADPNALTLFDVPAIAEVITDGPITITYQKTGKHLQPGHKGRNSFPDALRREEQILYPEGIDLARVKKSGKTLQKPWHSNLVSCL